MHTTSRCARVCWLLFLFLPLCANAQRLTWSRIWGASENDYAQAVTCDKQGAIYVAGHTQGSFLSQTNSGKFDAFLTKFDASGALLWTRIWGSPTNESVAGLAVDRSNNIYVAGTTVGSFDGRTNTLAPFEDFFVTRWTPDGSQVWTRIWGSPSNDTAAGIVVDRAGNVYVGGYTFGQFGTPGQTNTRLGRADFCLSALSSDGAFQWSQIWGSTNSDYCYAIAIDSYDWIYLAGTASGSRFDDQTNLYPAVTRLALTAYYEGVRRWSRVWGPTNKNASANAVAADGLGNVFVAGTTFGAFDGEPFVGSGFNSDFFLTRFDDSGNKLWTRIRGGTSWEEAYATWADGAGNVYVGGVTGGDFDSQTRAGGSDFMLVKFSVSGTHGWTRFWGSASDENGIYGLAPDARTNLLACGTTFGSLGYQTNPGGDSPALSRWRITPNTAPQLVISRPIGMREFMQEEVIPCIGEAADEDDGLLTNLVWSIGTNTSFGYGPTSSVTAAVSPGQQFIVAQTVDSEGATGTAQVAVEILERGDEGLPATWQNHYWPGGGSGGPTNDADGDGFDNFSEWLVGTNPTDPFSYFRCAIIALASSEAVLSWPSRTNMTYTVWSSPHLVNTEFGLVASPDTTPPINTTTIAVHESSTRCFQIRAER